MLSKEEIEKAKERVNNLGKSIQTNCKGKSIIATSIKILLQYIAQLEQENNKQFKIIDEMAKEIKKTDYSYYYCNSTKECTGEECKECIKQYFEKKVGGELNES